MQYIALLRGINVSGKNRLSMTDLTALCQKLGYENIRTYVQSGNVVFSANQANEADLEQALAEKLGNPVPVILKTATKWRAIASENPFSEVSDLQRVYVTLLKETPQNLAIEPGSDGRDEWAIRGSTIYLHCPIDYGHSKLSNTFFERKLKAQATTRNWNTVQALLAMLNE